MTSKRITLYCDGAARGNGKEGALSAWGAILEFYGYEKVIGGVSIGVTNNQMELLACIKGLRAIKNKDVPVDVISDSQYLVKGMNEWIPNWIKNNWHNSNGKAIKNVDLWTQLLAEVKLIKEITFTHCYGHSDNDGNNRVDALINKLMDEYKGE